MSAAPAAEPQWNGRRVVSRMAKRFRPYRWQVLLSSLMVLSSVGLGIAGPLILLRIVDEALPERDLELLAWLCGSLVGVGALSGAMAYCQSVLTSWTGQRVIARLRADTYDRVAAQPLTFFGRGHSEVQSRMISDIGAVERLVTTTAQSFIGSLANLIGFVIVMVILSWPLAVVSLAAAFLLSLLNNRFARRRKALSKQRQLLLAELMKRLGEHMSFQGQLLSRTMNQEAAQRARIVAGCDDIRDTVVRQAMVGAAAASLVALAFACIPPLIYWMGGTFFADLTIGTILVLVMMQLRLSGPIQSLLRISGNLQTSTVVFERMFEYLDLPMDEPAPREPAGPRPPASTIRLREVSYTYPGRDGPALDKVSLRLPSGTATVIVGRSGSGKSTLAMVLAGLMSPCSGTVEIDGRPVTPEALRRIVTLVPQDPVLFDCSLRENLAFGARAASDEAIERVVALVGLDRMVAALPQGIGTRVGDGGRALSGGERQRIGLARAMLADCRMLVVDEPTGSLDGMTARQVYSVLREHTADKALVLITHQDIELRPGDRVVSVSDGRASYCGERFPAHERMHRSVSRSDDLGRESRPRASS
ncbi:ABC transporter ATP-binding protein [Glycomyces tenuis]|uniref:ABC transporter ATP-binding protein n=1 Tax=Glycomyces tenuis TaxID=58116 RepID=UPI00040EFEAE|nr:ABC transporter ATP-binding protein [Glycomyces tenuis]